MKADFCAGLLEASARRLASAPNASVTVLERSHEHCVLDLRR